MAVYAALVSLLNNIDQITNHPLLSTSLDKDQIEPLTKTAASLLGFIEGNSHGGVVSNEVEDLEKQIAYAAHAAEDAIESYIFDKIHAGNGQASLECSLDLHQIIQDMDAILKRADELKQKEGLRLSQEQRLTDSRRLIEGKETGMVGFEDELIQLMDDLTNQRSSRHVISIVGMGGAGKTTLAQNVYENLTIKRHFDIRARATISQQYYSAKDTLSQLLSDRGSSSSRNVDDLGLELHKTLYGRRYLVMFDDIWSVEAWDDVRRFFPDNGNGSRVILTTRMSNVARDCRSDSCITMKPLDEHKSWQLLCKNAFEQESCPYLELEKVGKEIARLCGGLPLSIVVIGGLLLKSPRSLQFWEKVAFNIKSSPHSKEKEESLDILLLSYNHLPHHLKPCFLYMGIFKEDSEIRVSKIIKLWIAEGFLRLTNTGILEEIAEGYVKELIDRNLISVRKLRCNGKIGSCGIHDLLRDLCLKISKQQEFHHVTEVEEVLDLKLLRVWNEGYIESPAELFGNVNLRYIAFQPFFHPLTMTRLPSSISLLWNLQTLIVTYFWSDTLVVAPVEIWKMRQLRHLKFTKLYLPPPDLSDSNALFMMDELQTLTTAVNLRLSKEVCKMIPNIKKLHLDYGDEWEGYDGSLIECLCNLNCLHELESLDLSVPNLDIKQNKMITFPISLNKLFLSGPILGWEDLWMIGLLPQLQVLKLLGIRSKVGNEWSPANEQFLGLKCLEIAICDLTVWNAGSSHFPVLEKLVLSGLNKLEEIPLDIGEIPTLELIRVDYCNMDTAISAVKIKKEHLENQGNDDLQVHVNMSKAQLEGFKERVKEEGLTTSNIYLLPLHFAL